jgi:hypothetical protein
VAVVEDDQVHLVQTNSGATTASFTGELVEVLAGNEVLLNQGGQTEHRDATGGLIATLQDSLAGAVRVGQAIWAKFVQDAQGGPPAVGGLYGLLTYPGNRTLDPWSLAITTGTNILFPQFPVVRNLTNLEVTVKNGGCHAGFSQVPAGQNYYGWVDGVKPGAVTGWNADDWFKVPDLAHVVVHPNGAQPTAHGPSTMMVPGHLKFCRQDDDTQPNYYDCWGRRIQPRWSNPTPNGFGEDTWIEPRPAGVVCGAIPKWWEVKKWC